MSYATRDGKDTVLFVDKDYVESQPDVGEPTVDNAETVKKEQDQRAAYDPETGEINWDCPCKGVP